MILAENSCEFGFWERAETMARVSDMLYAVVALQTRPDHKTPAVDRSPFRSWACSPYLIQGDFHCVPHGSISIGYGMEDTPQHRLDQLTNNHFYLGFYHFAMLKDKEEAVWLEMVARLWAEQNVASKFPIRISRVYVIGWKSSSVSMADPDKSVAPLEDWVLGLIIGTLGNMVGSSNNVLGKE